jgi:hypothetical protein
MSLLMALLALVFSTAQSAVVLSYRAATEDDSSSGNLRMSLSAGRVMTAVVWERECALASKRDADAPGVDSDQFWSFRVELTKDPRGRPAARVRYRAVKGPAKPGAEQDRLLLLDGKDTLAIDGFSARTDCRYDRIHLTVSGG